MKKNVILILALSMALALCGCGHKHTWAEATCTEPRTCTSCGETEGSARGHSWTEATCTEPRTCTSCGETDGSALGHSWTKETDTTPRMCLRCGEMIPMLQPLNGQVLLGANLSRRSEITISASEESAYIKLKDASGTDVFSFFVRANQTATVEVPGGNYYVYFACGDDWYGPRYYFGNTTSFSKDSEIIDFNQYTVSYTLYKTTGGNFSETPISEDEFD